MTTKKTKPPAIAKSDPRALQLVQDQDETAAQAMGRVAPDPAINAGSVMQTYGGHLGGEVDLMSMIDAIDGSTKRVKAGDLSDLEAMLVAQATALQTIFTNLARRAHVQQHQRNFEAFLGLALKAQSQCRSTITALVDLKYPRQVAFVKQANINSGSGNQQVNNASFESSTLERTQAEEMPNTEIKELGASDGQWLDTGTKSAAGRTDPHMEAVGEGNGSKEPRRKGKGGP